MAVFVVILHANCWGFWMNESFKVTFIWCFQIFISIHLTSHSDVGFQQKHTNYKIVANIADKLQPHFQKSWGTYCKMQFTICDLLILPILTHKSTKKNKIKTWLYLQKYFSWSVKTLEIFSLYICPLNKGWRELKKSQILYKMSQLFWKWDCY